MENVISVADQLHVLDRWNLIPFDIHEAALFTIKNGSERLHMEMLFADPTHGCFGIQSLHRSRGSQFIDDLPVVATNQPYLMFIKIR